MTTAPQTNASNRPAPAANQTTLIVRVVLFAILAYLLVALVYDRMYMYTAHEEGFKKLQSLVDAEAARSAEDIAKNGPTSPAKVQETLGFAPAVPLTDHGHYQEEVYKYRSGLLFRTRDLYVFYKGKDKPGVVSVASNEEDRETVTPSKAVEPNEKAAAGEAPAGEAPAGEAPAGEKPAEEKPAEEKPAEETPAEEKPADDAAAPAEEAAKSE